MKAGRPLNVVFFKTAAGHEPVRLWLKALPNEDCTTIGVDISNGRYCLPLGRPLVSNLGDGIWKIRSHVRDSLRRQGLLEEVEKRAMNQVLALQLADLLKENELTNPKWRPVRSGARS